MAKKIVEVDEDLLKGMMTSDIPLYGRDTEPAPKKRRQPNRKISLTLRRKERSRSNRSQSGTDEKRKAVRITGNSFWSIRRVRTVRRPT